MSLSVFRIFLLFGLIVISSCSKDRGVIETQLVVTKYDKKIPTDFDIIDFDTYSENHIFAVGHDGYLSVKLFLSANGGTTWDDITAPFDLLGWNGGFDLDKVQDVVYMDENNLALVTGNKLFRSYDGGQSWTIMSDGIQMLRVFFADKSEDGNLLFIEDFNSSWAMNKIDKSAYDSQVFSTIGTMPPAIGKYDAARLYGNYIMLLDYTNDYYYSATHGYNLTTGQYESLAFSGTSYDYPVDAMKVGERIFLIRKDGKLNFMSPTGAFVDYSFYNFHNQDYYSGEFMGDYYIAVGDRTISTNISGKWEEAINPDITGQQEVFRKVKKIDSDHFYVSGNSGLFFKGTFK
ncbi:WD40/YVTN/BNR-like repeat-containing protein [Fluviicola sp.]|uniref:WD40/YVTN/BNR-like repeat-containing protein n=1 Tax=Fluviicola sp. TaxID=1917219 RepID=UPI003D2AB990